MRLASRGLRDLDGGEEAVGDELERRALAQQGQQVLRESLLWAVALTAVVTLLPFPR